MKVLLTMLAALAAAACTPRTPGQVAQPPAGPCNAGAVEGLLGQDASKVLLEAQKRGNAKTVRVYRVGSMVTMDYREDRLNLQVDERNHIMKVTCG